MVTSILRQFLAREYKYQAARLYGCGTVTEFHRISPYLAEI